MGILVTKLDSSKLFFKYEASPDLVLASCFILYCKFYAQNHVDHILDNI